MCKKYNYFIVKPDGIRYFNEICDVLSDRFEEVTYFPIMEFDVIIKKLYHKHYEQKENFAISYEAYLYGLKEIFGNHGVVLLVSDSRFNQEQLDDIVYKTKSDVRDMFVNDNVGIVTNYGTEPANYIKFVDDDGNHKSPRILSGLGSHRISNLNIIHCPDNDGKSCLDELSILYENGILDSDNKLPLDIVSNIRRYKSTMFFMDINQKGKVNSKK